MNEAQKLDMECLRLIAGVSNDWKTLGKTFGIPRPCDDFRGTLATSQLHKAQVTVAACEHIANRLASLEDA